ncbi:hypothetical protein STEG23_023641 [Scotinomys teguina]
MVLEQGQVISVITRADMSGTARLSGQEKQVRTTWRETEEHQLSLNNSKNQDLRNTFWHLCDVILIPQAGSTKIYLQALHCNYSDAKNSNGFWNEEHSMRSLQHPSQTQMGSKTNEH